jgi:hypothetical protein
MRRSKPLEQAWQGETLRCSCGAPGKLSAGMHGVPYLRPFPVWKYDEDEGWWPESFGMYWFSTAADAEQFIVSYETRCAGF